MWPHAVPELKNKGIKSHHSAHKSANKTVKSSISQPTWVSAAEALS